MWKKISSKEILNHPRMSLVEDVVELPNGKQTKYLKYKDDGWAAASVICQREDGKILVQKEYSYPPNKVLFQFPGGLVEKGEKPEVGANRELMEEAGLKASDLNLLGKYLINNRRTSALHHVYLATEFVEESLESDPEESFESFWFTEDEIDKMIKAGEIYIASFLSAWSLFKLK